MASPGEDAREPVVQAGFPRSEVFGSFRRKRPTGAVFGKRAAARVGSGASPPGEDAREPVAQAGFPRSETFGSFRRKRSSLHFESSLYFNHSLRVGATDSIQIS